MASKYDPLGTYLSSQYGSEVTMTFGKIEQVLGFPLPPSSRFRAWWSNNDFNSAMTKVWRSVGFRSERVDIAGETVVFVRELGTQSGSGFREGATDGGPRILKAPRRHPAIGAMKGMIKIMPGVDLTEPTDPEWVQRLFDDKATAGDLVGGLDDPKPTAR